MTFVYAWLIALSTSLGLDPSMLPGAEGEAPAMYLPPPPPPPPTTTEQAPNTRPTKPGTQNDIYNGF